MVKNGVGCGNKAEARCTEILKKPEFILTIDLNMGSEHDSMMTCDFSLDYVKINANYRT
jgi:glutamate N-acetyltransferase/amino-acid N-acetyltransferase